MSWIDDPWMGFDTETTGVRALKDRLVTAALVLRIDGASYRSGVSAPDQVATWLTDPVGGTVDAQHQRGGDEAVLERAHARRLGVKTHPRVVDPAHGCSCPCRFHQCGRGRAHLRLGGSRIGS